MERYIKVSDSLRNELAGVSTLCRTSVWAALNYLTNSDRAKDVRKYALEHGGVIVEKDFTPNCETSHTVDEIIQTFAGGVQVRLSKKDSHALILVDGKEEESYDSVSFTAWGNLLRHAQDLSEERVAKLARK